MLTRREALALAATLPLTASAAEPTFEVATFEAEVTPPIGHPCMGGGIAPVKEILDPLFAHGFVLYGSGKPIVVVTVDWCEIRNAAYDRWRGAIAEAVGTDRVRVLVSANHQHDTPVADLHAEELLVKHTTGASICDRDFHEKAVKRVAAAAKAAKRRPITHVGVGQAAVEKVASNRRYVRDGQPFYNRMSATRDAAIRAAEEGTVDPHLKLLTLWDGDTPLVALNSYATHPMSFYGKGGCTADFVGLARKRRQADTPGALQMYASGCSGNVTAGKYNDGSPDNRPALAERMYQAMAAAWKATKKHPIQVAFRSTELKLKPRASAGFTMNELLKKLTTGPRPFDKCLAAMGLSWKQRCEAGKPIDVPVIDFGVAHYLLLPAESYVEFQLAAQELRPDSFVVVAGYGECGPGYIPIERAWKENDGNLADWCWVAEGSEAKMRAAMAAVLKK